MEAETYKYTTLICSLPGFESLTSLRRTPISRIQLRQRLRMLDPRDFEDIEILGELLDWFRQPAERSDQEFIRLLEKRLQQVRSKFIVESIVWRLELRSIIAALRHKRAGVAPDTTSWGYGRWQPLMQKHWQEPLMGMDKLHPWVSSARKLLEEDKAYELEKFILLHVWNWLKRRESEHDFDFPAVAIYRMKWDLAARWTSYDTASAEQRFRRLLADTLLSAKSDDPGVTTALASAVDVTDNPTNESTGL